MGLLGSFQALKSALGVFLQKKVIKNTHNHATTNKGQVGKGEYTLSCYYKEGPIRMYKMLGFSRWEGEGGNGEVGTGRGMGTKRGKLEREGFVLKPKPRFNTRIDSWWILRMVRLKGIYLKY